MGSKQKVVIIGGGFGGLAAARALKDAEAEVTIIDRRNHHLFQPLLYQVATGGLSPANISAPIRGLVSKQENTRVLLGDVTDIDVKKRELKTSIGPVPYDTLIVATGSSHSYFGNDQWAEFAPGLKTIENATNIRKRILLAFESAEMAVSEEERKAWLTFVVVGGGPTGVEMAGAIAELARHTLKGDFRTFDPKTARILLVEAGPKVLGTYSKSIPSKAESALKEIGVEVMTNTMVTDIDYVGVTIKRDDREDLIRSRTVVWGAGVTSSPLGKKIGDATGCEMDKGGRVVVEPDLSIKDHPEIFVIGDLASYSHQTGSPLRGTADVAGAEGKYVGRLITAKSKGEESKDPFHFRDLGKLAVIGRTSAVADLPYLRFGGYLAWQAWLFIHILKLVGYQNRATVLVQWAWSYFTRKKSARLITGEVDWAELADVRAEEPVDAADTARDNAA